MSPTPGLWRSRVSGFLGSSRGGYPALLQEKLLAAGYNVRVINEGVPGEHSYVTDSRLLGSIVGSDIVLIMIGTNDVIDPRFCLEPYNCRITDYINSMINKALISNIVPIVSTIPPAKPGSSYDWANFDIENWNQEIFRLAAAHGIPLVDTYNAILSGGGTSLYSYRLHFTDQGYNIIAEQFYTAMVENKIIQNSQR